MKIFKIFFITLLISLIIVFAVYPDIVFAQSSASYMSCSFPAMFIIAIFSSVILAIIAYIVGKIINKK